MPVWFAPKRWQEVSACAQFTFYGCQTRSTVLTSQLPVSRWHEQIGDPTIADGILDRLVHNAHRIEMRGESMPQETQSATGREEGMNQSQFR